LTDAKEPPNSAPQVQAPRDNWWVRFVGYVKRKSEERTAKKKNETSTDKAARRTAVATIWMAIFTCILAATSGLTICVLRNQLKEMQESRKQTEVLVRPWITFDLTQGPGGNKYDGGTTIQVTGISTLHIMHYLINTGHSPGYVFMDEKIVGYYVDRNITSESEQVCESGHEDLKFPNNLTWVVIPGTPMLYGRDKQIDKNDPTSGGGKEFSIFGCIVYRSLGDGAIHQTPFTAKLNASTKANPCPGGSEYCATNLLIIGKAD